VTPGYLFILQKHQNHPIESIRIIHVKQVVRLGNDLESSIGNQLRHLFPLGMGLFIFISNEDQRRGLNVLELGFSREFKGCTHDAYARRVITYDHLVFDELPHVLVERSISSHRELHEHVMWG
jgi:hypothetical protein